MKAILLQPKHNIHSSPLYAVKRTVSRFFLLLVGCILLMQAQSQTDKRLALADQYFTAGEYITAAGLYGQFLKPVVKSKAPSDFPLNTNRNAVGRIGAYANKTDILFKQAESYRLANYWTEAAALYKECFEKDPAAYAAALYWLAVCQRSTGNYIVAAESISRFLNDYAAGHPYRKAAEKEKQTLEFIKSQLIRPDSLLYQIQKIPAASGATKGIFAPVATTANQFLVTSTGTDSVAAGISPFHSRLFTSVLTDNGLETLEPISIASIDSSFHQGAASISADGRYLYFTQWKKENGKVISSIYYSGKVANGWSEPKLLTSIDQKGYSSKQPFCTAEGKYLFFASDRSGGLGNFDIWYASLQPDGTTGKPVNAGPLLNSPEDEQSPFYHSATGTLVFASDRMPGMGGYDLFTAKGWGTEWKAPENMGYPVNSPRDDVYFFSAGKGSLLSHAIFNSDRGSECCLALYSVSKTPKKQVITGVLRDCRNNEPVADADVTMKDAAGKAVQTATNADGKYSFELTGDTRLHQLFIRKEKYNDKAADVMIEGSNETHWQTDTLYNADLCIEKKLVIRVENVVTIYFDFNLSKLKNRGMAQLDSIYNVLIEDPKATIQISGYTDGLGSVEYNQILSDKRAKACADYLIQKGIEAGRISFESFGACCPVEMELINGRDNPDGRSKNRRALINISKEEPED
jgi:OmpA-OmpF porin, OOP family